MNTLIKSEDRGVTKLDWLDSRHAFSFSPTAPSNIWGPGVLRVINEDRIEPGQGFPEHPHPDMEIISYLITGSLAHKDTLGNVTEVRQGEVQRMTAGTGIRHSEYNPNPEAPNHFLQIWILPEEKGLEPGYEQKLFQKEDKQDAWQLIASPNGREGSITVHQQAELWSSIVSNGTTVERGLPDGRDAWLQVVSGQILVDGTELNAGDGLHVHDASSVNLTGIAGESEVLLFDIPAAEMRRA